MANQKPYPEIDGATYDGIQIQNVPGTGEVGNVWRPALPIAPTYSFLNGPGNAAPFDPVGAFNRSNTQGQMQLALPLVSKPTDFAQAPQLQTQQPQNPIQGQLDQRTGTILGALSATNRGFGAGSQVQPTRDAGSAALQAVGAGVGGAAQGAAAGAALGSVVPGLGTAVGAGAGAALGGVVGLVTGGIQSYVGLRAARAEKREADRIYKEIQETEERRYNQRRSDEQEQLRYNRKSLALQAQWAAAQQAGQKLRTLIQDDETLKQLFIRDGR